jgi:3D-(3,5/4)-trihydroxycyclohexane-1,2-dione acylhydrolase (decyclizing)
MSPTMSAPRETDGSNRPNSYAQAIGVVNALCDPRDRVVTAAGGLPAEVAANWRTLDIGTVDVEFGFSCMGYEIAGGWGARIAQSENEPDSETIVFVGDGSYLLMNSDIYSSVLTAKKLIVLVLDNGGFAVINKLQNNMGQESFNNLIADCPTVPEPFTSTSPRTPPRWVHWSRRSGKPHRARRGLQARQGGQLHQRDRHECRRL